MNARWINAYCTIYVRGLDYYRAASVCPRFDSAHRQTRMPLTSIGRAASSCTCLDKIRNNDSQRSLGLLRCVLSNSSDLSRTPRRRTTVRRQISRTDPAMSISLSLVTTMYLYLLRRSLSNTAYVVTYTYAFVLDLFFCAKVTVKRILGVKWWKVQKVFLGFLSFNRRLLNLKTHPRSSRSCQAPCPRFWCSIPRSTWCRELRCRRAAWRPCSPSRMRACLLCEPRQEM